MAGPNTQEMSVSLSTRTHSGATCSGTSKAEKFARYERRWAQRAGSDVQRALEMGERSPHTRRLLGLDAGPILAKLANRAVWYGAGVARGLSAALKKWTELTGSRTGFRIWQQTARAQSYWQAVREAGVRRAELRELAGHPLRVLMLHSIAEPRNSDEASYYLSPDRWRMLLETMKARGYYCADPAKLEDPAASWGERELVLTFDDGYDDFYTGVFPFIEDYGLKPIVFLPVDRIGDENRWDHAIGVRARKLLNTAQVRELRRHGVRFGSHSLTHPSLVNIGDAQLRRELVDSRQKLEDLLGEQITMLAYPFGANNRRVRNAATEAGYKLAFSTVEGLNLWEDPFSLRRVEFNQVLPPIFYRWKLHRGHGPGGSIRKELRPLYHSLPSKMRAKLESTRKPQHSHPAAD